MFLIPHNRIASFLDPFSQWMHHHQTNRSESRKSAGAHAGGPLQQVEL
jgi:hypothetical protein